MMFTRGQRILFYVVFSAAHALFWLFLVEKSKTYEELRDEQWDRAGLSEELQQELRKGRPGHEFKDYTQRLIERWKNMAEPNEPPPVIWFKPSENVELDI